MKGKHMFNSRCRSAVGLLSLGMALALAGCSSQRTYPAPVEERPVGPARPVAPAVLISPVPAPAPAPAAVSSAAPAPAGAPAGGYVVKPGDTLIRIGLDNGQNWRDIARWNNIENPNLIEVGQVLRVVPPAPVVDTAVLAQPVTVPSVTGTPVPPAMAAVGPRTAASAPQPVAALASVEEEIAWIWPTAGPLLGGFDEVKNKGLDIGGRIGDPVVAVADGRVVYAGAGLRGYGNLVILKHNNTFLTAYAHNQALLVKEDQAVRKGQKIAEMGSSDTDKVKLHFEIRRQGKPVDPAKYLPAR
jgi:lipoprotein NlpD